MTTNAFSVAERTSQLTNFSTRALFLSLHSAFPGDTGASELTGGTPAYARGAVTWGAASAGAIAAAVLPTFNVPANTDVLWVGYWTLITAGTFLGAGPAGSVNPLPFLVRDSVVADTFQADHHGFANGNQVIFMDTDVGVLPTGITEGTAYYVVNAATDSFQVSTTSGGTAVTLTSDGTGFVGLITPEHFNSAGTYTPTSITIAQGR